MNADTIPSKGQSPSSEDTDRARQYRSIAGRECDFEKKLKDLPLELAIQWICNHAEHCGEPVPPWPHCGEC